MKTERWRRTLSTKQFEVLTTVCEELDTTYLDILARCKEEVEGAKEILSQLSKKAMIGVLSNGFSSTQYKKIRNSGLDRYICRMVVSEEIGINKPDKRVFDYAIRATGAAGKVLMAGDNAETDILGAMQAGWNAIWINHKGDPFPFTEEELKRDGINPALLLGNVSSLKAAYPLINQFLDKENFD